MHQAGEDRGRYDSEPAKYLRTKNMRTVLALIEGIRCGERARLWLGECNRIGVHEDVRKAVVERVRVLSG